jgi:cellobiose phosphorylase
VVCADVYGARPHTGRGGWTWYTGSAGWLYRVALEAILGFHPKGRSLRLDPCIPRGWPGIEINYGHRSTTDSAWVDNLAGTGRGVRSVALDGRQLPGGAVPLSDDGKHHEVRVDLG